MKTKESQSDYSRLLRLMTSSILYYLSANNPLIVSIKIRASIPDENDCDDSETTAQVKKELCQTIV